MNRWIMGKIAEFNQHHGRMSPFVTQLNVVRYNGGDWREFLNTIQGPPEPKDWLTNFSLRYVNNKELTNANLHNLLPRKASGYTTS